MVTSMREPSMHEYYFSKLEHAAVRALPTRIAADDARAATASTTGPQVCRESADGNGQVPAEYET
jgi:hypothetical protein